MSAPSSPGRTWRTLNPERGLCALAAAVSTGLRGGCNCGAHVRVVARLQPAATAPHGNRPRDSVDERRGDRIGVRDVGGFMVAVPMTLGGLKGPRLRIPMLVRRSFIALLI